MVDNSIWVYTKQNINSFIIIMVLYTNGKMKPNGGLWAPNLILNTEKGAKVRVHIQVRNAVYTYHKNTRIFATTRNLNT